MSVIGEVLNYHVTNSKNEISFENLFPKFIKKFQFQRDKGIEYIYILPEDKIIVVSSDVTKGHFNFYSNLELTVEDGKVIV